MIEHVVATLRPVVDEVIVVTSEEVDLPPLQARVVFDRCQGGGPLVGIREGLRAANADWAFVTSVDAPFLSPELVEDLFSLGCAAAPVAQGHVQVLSAVYPCAAWRIADELLEQDSRRPLRLLERLEYRPIEFASTDGPAPWQGFNTPKEYLDAVRRREPGAVAEIEFLGRAARKGNRLQRRLEVGTLGDLFAQIPGAGALLSEGRLHKSHLVCLGGRDLVRDLSVPVGPGERVSVIDALAGG